MTPDKPQTAAAAIKVIIMLFSIAFIAGAIAGHLLTLAGFLPNPCLGGL